MSEIPRPLAAIVGEVLGSYVYNHRRLEALFWECGAPDDPPQGNCCEKVERWLVRAGQDSSYDALGLLGRVLENFMEADTGFQSELQEEGRIRIRKALSRHGLTYAQGGRIMGAGAGPASRTLNEILQDRDLPEIEAEFDRAISGVASNSRDAITAACAILESLCRIYIDERNLELPTKQTVKPLWAVVQKDLGLDPASLKDKDLARILTGLTSVVDGIGALRTHAGSAHGRDRKSYRTEARHARLAINAAHTLVVFLLETWESRVQARTPRNA